MRTFTIKPIETGYDKKTGEYAVEALILDMDKETHNLCSGICGPLDRAYRQLGELVSFAIKRRLMNELESPPECERHCTNGFSIGEHSLSICESEECAAYVKRLMSIGERVETVIQVEDPRGLLEVVL